MIITNSSGMQRYLSPKMWNGIVWVAIPEKIYCNGKWNTLNFGYAAPIITTLFRVNVDSVVTIIGNFPETYDLGQVN